MSCECVSSPSDRTSAHRSPMVCSRRGFASNTAGNWLIHCLAIQWDRKYVYYPQIEQYNQFLSQSVIQDTHVPGVPTHLIKWQICVRLRSLLSEGQSL